MAEPLGGTGMILMWQLLKEIADWVDPIGVLVGLITAVPVFWTWWEIVFGARRRRRELFREARRHQGERPAILVVDFLPGKDMDAAVAHARRNLPALADIPDERLVRVRLDHWLEPDDMPEVYRLIQHAARELLVLGADVVHLFYGGPSIGAAVLGTELANGARVLFYQHHQGRYQNFGPLREPRIR